MPKKPTDFKGIPIYEVEYSIPSLYPNRSCDIELDDGMLIKDAKERFDERIKELEKEKIELAPGILRGFNPETDDIAEFNKLCAKMMGVICRMDECERWKGSLKNEI